MSAIISHKILLGWFVPFYLLLSESHVWMSFMRTDVFYTHVSVSWALSGCHFPLFSGLLDFLCNAPGLILLQITFSIISSSLFHLLLTVCYSEYLDSRDTWKESLYEEKGDSLICTALPSLSLKIHLYVRTMSDS